MQNANKTPECNSVKLWREGSFEKKRKLQPGWKRHLVAVTGPRHRRTHSFTARMRGELSPHTAQAICTGPSDRLALPAPAQPCCPPVGAEPFGGHRFRPHPSQNKPVFWISSALSRKAKGWDTFFTRLQRLPLYHVVSWLIPVLCFCFKSPPSF